MRRRPRTWSGDRSGVVAVEFALLAPFLMALLIGFFEVASFVRVSLKLSHAANSLAKAVAQQVDSASTGVAVTKSNLNDYCTGAGYVLAPFAAGKLAASIVSVTATTSGGATTPAKDWEYDGACSTAGTSYAASAVTLAGSSGYSLATTSGASVIVVQASYTYVPLLHYLLRSSWTLTQTAFAPARQGSTVTCGDCSS